MWPDWVSNLGHLAIESDMHAVNCAIQPGVCLSTNQKAFTVLCRKHISSY